MVSNSSKRMRLSAVAIAAVIASSALQLLAATAARASAPIDPTANLPVDRSVERTVVTSSVAPLVAPGGFVRAAVACPTGKLAVAGGAAVVGEGAGDFPTPLHDSAPTNLGDGRTGWLGSVRNDDTVSHKIAIIAVCIANAPPGFHYVRQDFVAQPFSVLRTAVFCATGAVVLGGGAATFGAGSDFITIEESAPGIFGGTSAYFTSVRNDGSVARTVTFLAACASPPSGYQVPRFNATVASGKVSSGVSSCPSGTVGFGGGVGVLVTSNRTTVVRSQPGTIGINGFNFVASIRNEDPVALTITFAAICAFAPPGYERVSTTF